MGENHIHLSISSIYQEIPERQVELKYKEFLLVDKPMLSKKKLGPKWSHSAKPHISKQHLLPNLIAVSASQGCDL